MTACTPRWFLTTLLDTINLREEEYETEWQPSELLTWILVAEHKQASKRFSSSPSTLSKSTGYWSTRVRLFRYLCVLSFRLTSLLAC